MTDANGTGNNINAGSRYSPIERPASKHPSLNRRARAKVSPTDEKTEKKQALGRRSRRRSRTTRAASANPSELRSAQAGQSNGLRANALRARVSSAPDSKPNASRTSAAKSPLDRGNKGGAAIGPASDSRLLNRSEDKSASQSERKVGEKRKTGEKIVALKKPASVHKLPTAQKLSANRSAARKPSLRRRSSRKKTPVWIVRLSCLVIGGLGIAAIGGTLLEVFSDSSAPAAVETAPPTQAERAIASFPIPLNQEMAALKAEMQELPNLYPDLTPKAFYIDVDSGDYVNLEGGDGVAAASTIKLPILLAFFEEVDAGRLTFEQTIEMLPEQIAEGSGDMQMAAPGTRFTALEVATQMIVTSDNTATNMMIDLLGGPAALNERFTAYGLEKTQLNAPLPDVEGTNKTSAKDLVRTMLLISSDRLTLRSRDRILNILNRTHNKALLAEGMVQREALTYNKTGYIGTMLGDVALVDLANGKRYVVAVLVERPMNDNRAAELIHRISDITHKASNEAIQPAVTPLGDLDGARSETDTNAASEEGVGAGSEGLGSEDIGSTGAEGIEDIGIEGAGLEDADGAGVQIAPIEEEAYPSANP